MLTYLLRRLVLAAITVFAITVVTFIILHLPPGDFVSAYAAQASASGTAISAAEADALRLAYGLNQPLWVQYWKWLAMVARGVANSPPCGTQRERSICSWVLNASITP